MSKKVAVTKPKTVAIAESQVHASEQTPDMMLAVAVSKGMDLAYIEKLMELQDKWLARKAEAEFAQALSNFQSLIPDLKKTGKAKFTYQKKDGSTGEMSYKHDDIGVLKAFIREPLSQCGLSQTWDEWEENDKIYVACVIQHIGGYKKIGKPLSFGSDTSGNKNGLQGKGSTLTYLRRYTLTGMLGLSSSEDDDGHGASASTSKGDGNDLPKLNDGQFNNFVKKVVAEKNWTMERIDATCSLSPDQRVAIQDILNSLK